VGNRLALDGHCRPACCVARHQVTSVVLRNNASVWPMIDALGVEIIAGWPPIVSRA